MRHNQPQEFIGIDVGDVRIGVARGSSVARLAQSLQTIPAKGAVERLSQIAQINQAAAIVVGLPRNLDGHDTNQTKVVRDWVRTAQDHIKLPFYWQDEALTSVNAADDAAAAAHILQDFLDSPEAQRVRC